MVRTKFFMISFTLLLTGCGWFVEGARPIGFGVHFHNTCAYPVQVGYRSEHPAPEDWQLPFETTLINPGETKWAIGVECYDKSSFFDSALEWTSKCLIDGNHKFTVQISANNHQKPLDKVQLMKVLENSPHTKYNGVYIWTISDPSLCPG